MNKSNKAYSLFRIIFLALFLLFSVFPFYWIIVTSLKLPQEVFKYPIQYWPEKLSLINYENIFKISNFGTYFRNSLLVSAVGAGCSMVVAITGGYVLARYNFKGKSALMLAYLFTQMIPMFILLAPLYIMLGQMQMINKISTLMLLYTAMMIPYCTITLRGFFQRIPSSLEEAARIDGCSRLSALVRIILPIMAPGVAATYMFAFVQCWNEIFLAVMFIDDETLKTIPVALNSFIMKYDIDWGSLSAGLVLSIIPTILMFGFIQKYIAGGLTSGAIKE